MAEHQAGGSVAQLARLKQRGGFLGKLASEFQAGQKDVDQTAQSAQKLAEKAAAQAKAIKAKVRTEQERRRKKNNSTADAAAAARDSSEFKDVPGGDVNDQEGGEKSRGTKKKNKNREGTEDKDEDAGDFWARMEEEEGGSGNAPLQKASSLAVCVFASVCLRVFAFSPSFSFSFFFFWSTVNSEVGTTRAPARKSLYACASKRVYVYLLLLFNVQYYRTQVQRAEAKATLAAAEAAAAAATASLVAGSSRGGTTTTTATAGGGVTQNSSSSSGSNTGNGSSTVGGAPISGEGVVDDDDDDDEDEHSAESDSEERTAAQRLADEQAAKEREELEEEEGWDTTTVAGNIRVKLLIGPPGAAAAVDAAAQQLVESLAYNAHNRSHGIYENEHDSEANSSGSGGGGGNVTSALHDLSHALGVEAWYVFLVVCNSCASFPLTHSACSELSQNSRFLHTSYLDIPEQFLF